ncbi:putative serine/threonine-protein kinase iks1 [Friedmanniomyces endolithicus]|uniref:non-specific serine/threonine protein kinase n=1 Tax=Friedmanniomyces endolithicus TaxID=329885 RepID=A0AAN6FIW7_9PEZI|nr:putative serine/threonine-protein kinase iks1 [Friedmanniomyces endolithicus]KAK0295203.1 putative serine/threonine-protein kinase iks1 [Friedmanniomyces endolithicus]KAK0318585.1 putative serine/threonine-protein kinase iks1 [Friedmanniomyces endolithicus]KAK0931216.1 putative serine/threonine-protein kinase iks1 [Friedmanniomyces endolithicus]KAK1010365.1 putative serine/threonine-protein kinase iks1 [Friedmanniomyces endolithicus]
MADETPPRQMSLVPYSTDSAIVLRRGNAVVVYDTQSRQLQVRDTSDQGVEAVECPYCHRPYHNEPSRGRGSEEHGRTFSPERPFVDPDYFDMLAASRTPEVSGTNTPKRRLFQPAALRSGRSRDVSGAAPDPPTGPSFAGDESSTNSANGQGISSSAFSPGYFKQFFVEQGLLGKGGNGVVLLVEHFMDGVSLGQFACKRIPVGNNHSWLERVLVEVKLLQKIPHRNLVQYHWVWLEDHQPNRFGPSVPCLWILQEYCNGGDLHGHVLGPKEAPSTSEALKARMRRRSRGDPEPPRDLRGLSKLTFDEIFSFFKDITSGLHHLHSKGYIHRDLKPSNCLLQHDGAKTRVLISDFGEVQVAGSRRGSTGATGTISYCAPEVLRRESPDGTFGNFSRKSDIFSLGMIVHFMCFGRLPYANADDINEEDEDLDELRIEITSWPGFDDATRARPDLHEKLYKFLKRLLSVDPNERPSTGDILDSIRAGGNLSESSVDDAGPRVSSLDSPAHRPSPPGRKQSMIISRPGLSSRGRRQSGEEGARSLSPAKPLGGLRSRESSRPLSPIDSAITIRPRKIDLPAPPAESVPPPQQSPRLMLAPPPAHPLVGRLARFAQHPGTISGFRASLFVAKLLLLLLPCAPYAANSWLMFVLLGVAALDVGILSPNLQRSIFLAGIHIAAVVVAAQHGYHCERPAIVWETSGLDASPLGRGGEPPLLSSTVAT